MPDSFTDASQSQNANQSGKARRSFGATRYLAAAAHSDPAFREAVLNQVCRPEFRCKAPEFGIDEGAIINECYIADRRRKIRDALLLTALLVFLASSQFFSGLQYVISTNPANLGLLLQDYGGELFLLLISGTAILFVESLLHEHFTLRRRFGAQSPTVRGDAEQRQSSRRQNLVVYGGYSPFVGSGLRLRDWSFSVNLQKTTEGGRRENSSALSVTPLMAFVRSRLDRLAIPGLEHYHVLFADGRHIRDDRRLMASPYSLPECYVSDGLLSDETQETETCRRTYLCIAVTDWSGEVVLTTYVRFKKGESNLFAEASSFIVPPLKQAYYQLDSMDPSLKIRRLGQIALASLIAAPFRMGWSAFSVHGTIMQPVHSWSAAQQTRKAIRDNPAFNYGALTSIRQLGMENRFRVYFQQLDRDMHMKTVEQCLVDAIVDCLEEYDIDTSDIRERRSAILNTGVMIYGGVVNADAITAGSGAKSVVTKLQSMTSGAKSG